MIYLHERRKIITQTFCTPLRFIIFRLNCSNLRNKYARNDQFKAMVEKLTPYLFQDDKWDPKQIEQSAAEWKVVQDKNGLWSTFCKRTKGI